MQGSGSSAPKWPVVVHEVCRLWDFLGGAGQGQSPPVFCLRQQSEMAAPCAGLGDSQRKTNCESSLAAASAGPGAQLGPLVLV